MPIAEHQMPSDPLMRWPWASAVRAAIGTPEILARFRSETGNAWQPAMNGIEAAIDDATGAGEAFVSAFIDWFNAEIWGDLDLRAFSEGSADDKERQGA